MTSTIRMIKKSKNQITSINLRLKKEAILQIIGLKTQKEILANLPFVIYKMSIKFILKRIVINLQ